MFSIPPRSLEIHFAAAGGGDAVGRKKIIKVAQIRSNQSAARGVWGQSQSYHVSGEAYATRRTDIRGSDATFDKQQKGNLADVVKKKWKRAVLVKKSLGPKLHSVSV